MTKLKRHWDHVYQSKPATGVSWYQPSPDPSLRALELAADDPAKSLIDIGGGASTLVDGLLKRGWSDLTVLDITAPALAVAKERLGKTAEKVNWIVADVTQWRPTRSYDVWHDRAVFHFLTKSEMRAAYRDALISGTRSGSVIIVASFALDGPERCSGLPVCRYDADGLLKALGKGIILETAWNEQHETPAHAKQSFQWCLFRRR